MEESSAVPKWEDTTPVENTARVPKWEETTPVVKRRQWQGNAEDPLSFAPPAKRAALASAAGNAADPRTEEKRVALSYFFANEYQVGQDYAHRNLDSFIKNFYGGPVTVDAAYLHIAGRKPIQNEVSRMWDWSKAAMASFGAQLLQTANNVLSTVAEKSMRLEQDVYRITGDRAGEQKMKETAGLLRMQTREISAELNAAQEKIVADLNSRAKSDWEKAVNSFTVPAVGSIIHYMTLIGLGGTGTAIAATGLDAAQQKELEISQKNPDMPQDQIELAKMGSAMITMTAQAALHLVSAMALPKTTVVKTFREITDKGMRGAAQVGTGPVMTTAGEYAGLTPGLLEKLAAGGETVVPVAENHVVALQVKKAIDASLPAMMKMFGINIAGGSAVGTAEKLVQNAVDIGIGLKNAEDWDEGILGGALSGGLFAAAFSARDLYRYHNGPTVKNMLRDFARRSWAERTPSQRYEAKRNTMIKAEKILADPKAGPYEVARAGIIRDAANADEAAIVSAASEMAAAVSPKPAEPKPDAETVPKSNASAAPAQGEAQQGGFTAEEAEEVQRLKKELPFDPAETRARLEELKAMYPGARIEIVDDWPKELQQKIRASGKVMAKEVPAFFDIDNDTVYFNASNLRPSRADKIFVHEVISHDGVRALLGDRADEFYDQVYRDFADDEIMQRIVEKYQLAETDEYGDLLVRNMTAEQKQEAADEFVSALGEESIKPDGDRAPWYSRAISKIREILRRFFPNIPWTIRDIENLLRASARNLRRKRYSARAANADGQRFSIGGPVGAARMRDAEKRLENLALAKRLLKFGGKMDAIKFQTGWEKGGDGKWRYEMPDLKVKTYGVLPDGTEYEKSGPDFYFDGKLGDYIDAPEIFEAYPELRNLPLTVSPSSDGGSGGVYYRKFLDLETGNMTGGNIKLEIKNPSAELIGGVLVHEVQHAIQDIEGFARGGTPEEFEGKMDKLRPLVNAYVERGNASEKFRQYRELELDFDKVFEGSDADYEAWMEKHGKEFEELSHDPEVTTILDERAAVAKQFGNSVAVLRVMKYPNDPEAWKAVAVDDESFKEAQYRRLAGEVEARNATARMNMTDGEKRRRLLADTEDVAEEDKIYLQEALGGSAMAEVSEEQSTSEIQKNIVSVGLVPEDMPSPENPKVLRKWLKNFYRGKKKPVNVDKGWSISIPGTGIEETLNHIYRNRKNYPQDFHYRTLPVIDEMLRLAKFDHYEKPESSENSDMVSIFNVPVNFGKDGIFNARMVVKHFGEDKNYYDHKLTKFEALPDLWLQSEDLGHRNSASLTGNIPQSGKKSSGKLELLKDSVKQKFGSGKTSLRQVAAGFKKIDFQPGTVNLEKNGVGIFYFDKDKAARYTALSNRKGNIPTGFVHKIADAGINVKPQTETLQFRRWFRDSKVVDENGEPLVVYHGTNWDALKEPAGKAVFDYRKIGENFIESEGGFFFIDSQRTAESYGPNVLKAYLSIKNPLVVKAPAFVTAIEFFDRQRADLLGEARSGNYDGVIVDGTDYDIPAYRHKLYIAFSPKQIKSATDNIGTFDPDNPDIRFSLSDYSDKPDMEDADARAVAVLKPKYGDAPDFDEKEVAAFLREKGFDVTEDDARFLVMKAIYAVRSERARERAKRNMKQRDDWLYDTLPIYRHAVDFGGKGFRIKLDRRVAREDDNGSFLAKKNETGIESPELAKYIARQEGREGEENEIEEEIADFFRYLKKPELYQKYYDYIRETKEGERELDRQAKEEYAKFIEDEIRDVFESGESVSRERLEGNPDLARVVYKSVLNKSYKGSVSDNELQAINAALTAGARDPSFISAVTNMLRDDLMQEYSDKMRDFRSRLREESRDAAKLQQDAVRIIEKFIPPPYRGDYIGELARLAAIQDTAKRRVEFQNLCKRIVEQDATAYAQKAQEEQNARRGRAEQEARTAEQKAQKEKLSRDGADLAENLARGRIFELPQEARSKWFDQFSRIVKLSSPEDRIDAFDKLIQDVIAAGDALRKVKYLERIKKRLSQISPKVDKGRRIIGTRSIESQRIISDIDRIFIMTSADVDQSREELYSVISGAEANADNSGVEEAEKRLALLEVFGGLADRSGADAMKAYFELENVARTGRSELLDEIAARRAANARVSGMIVRRMTSGQGVKSGQEADDISWKMRENLLTGLKNLSFSTLKLEDRLYLMATNGETMDWLESPLGQIFQRVHQSFTREFSRRRTFSATRNEMLDEALGTQNSVSRAVAVQKLRERVERTGIMRYPVEGRKIEYRYVSIDDAKLMLARYDEGRGALIPYQAEILRDRLRDLDRRIDRTINSEETGDPATNEVYKAMDKEDREGQENLIGIPVVSFTRPPVEWQNRTQLEALTLKLGWAQRDVRYKMIFNGWTDESMRQLDAFLLPETKRLGELMVQYLAKQYDQLDAVYRLVYYAPLDHIENYWPMIYPQTRVTTNNTAPALDDVNAGLTAPRRLAPGSIKSRKAHLMEPKAADALTVFEEQVRRTDHFTEWALVARELRGVLFDPEVKAACDQVFGGNFFSGLKDDVIDTINGGPTAKIFYPVQKIFNSAVGLRMAFGYIQGVKQMMSGFAYANDVPLGDFVTDLAYSWTHPAETIGVLMKSEYLTNRFTQGADIFQAMALGGRNRYAATERLAGKIGKKIGLAGIGAGAAQAVEEAKYWGSIAMRAGDSFPVVLFGAAVYRYHYRRLIAQGFSPEEAQKKAILRWEMSSESLQQSAAVHNQNAWQKAQIGRIFTAFKSANILGGQRILREAIARAVYGPKGQYTDETDYSNGQNIYSGAEAGGNRFVTLGIAAGALLLTGVLINMVEEGERALRTPERQRKDPLDAMTGAALSAPLDLVNLFPGADTIAEAIFAFAQSRIRGKSGRQTFWNVAHSSPLWIDDLFKSMERFDRMASTKESRRTSGKSDAELFYEGMAYGLRFFGGISGSAGTLGAAMLRGKQLSDYFTASGRRTRRANVPGTILPARRGIR